MPVQIIGTFATDGKAITFGMSAGLAQQPMEQRQRLLAMCGRMLLQTAEDMLKELPVVGEGEKDEWIEGETGNDKT